MTLPSYGIPEKEVLQGQINDTLNANSAQLSLVYNPLLDSVGETMDANSSAIQSVAIPIGNTVIAAVNSNQKQLEKVAKQVTDSTIAQLSSNEALLNDVVAQTETCFANPYNSDYIAGQLSAVTKDTPPPTQPPPGQKQWPWGEQVISYTSGYTDTDRAAFQVTDVNGATVTAYDGLDTDYLQLVQDTNGCWHMATFAISGYPYNTVVGFGDSTMKLYAGKPSPAGGGVEPTVPPPPPVVLPPSPTVPPGQPLEGPPVPLPPGPGPEGPPVPLPPAPPLPPSAVVQCPACNCIFNPPPVQCVPPIPPPPGAPPLVEVAAPQPQVWIPKIGAVDVPDVLTPVLPYLPTLGPTVAAPGLGVNLQTFLCPKLPPSLEGGIPLPGTLRFCQIEVELTDWLEKIGIELLKWIVEQIDPQLMADRITQYARANSSSIPSIGWSSALLATLPPLLRAIKPIWDVLVSTIKCTWGLMIQLVPACNVNVLFSLHVARSLLDSLKDIEGGIDPAAWVVNNFSISFITFSNVIDRYIEYFCPLRNATPDEATESWLRGYIDTTQRDCVWKLHGLNPVDYEPFAKTRTEKVSPAEAIQWARRNGQTEEEQLAAIRKLGWADEEQAKAMLGVYDELPTITDHMHFLQRNVFDQQYVDDYKLMEGFDTRFWPKFGPDLRALGMLKKYAELHYAAHWVGLSPTVMREFVYRLRPGKPGVRDAFTEDDFERLLVEQDYNIRARGWLRETLYHVPALTYLRDMHRNNLITDDEMRGYHQDLGYNPKDSEKFVAIDSLRKLRMRATQGMGWNPAAVKKAYAGRIVSREFVFQRMDELGYTRKESGDLMDRADSDIKYQITVRARSRLIFSAVATVRNSLRIGIMDAEAAKQSLINAGWLEEQASGIAALESAGALADRMKHAITHLRGAFLRGEIDEEFAGQRLAAIGVVSDVRSDYMTAWRLELTPARRRRTAKQIVDDVSEGALDTPTAIALLTNLGYEEADRTLFLADARRAVVQLTADEVKAGDLGGKQLDAELAALAKGAGGLSKRLVDSLKRQAPVAKLQKWLKLGLIGEEYFRSRLVLYGYDPPVVDNYVKEAMPDEG